MGHIARRRDTVKAASRRNMHGRPAKAAYVAGITALLTIPLVYAGGTDTLFTLTGSPPTLLTGGTGLAAPMPDWVHALAWIKNHTPGDAVVAAWWDYGYWITTMGERATLADNATSDSERIERLAGMFMSRPDAAWEELVDMGADYVVVFVPGAWRAAPDGSVSQYYMLQHGGDESKKQWFIRIAGLDEREYLHTDGMSGTDLFWHRTALGKLVPFSPVAYVDPSDAARQYGSYAPGTVAIYAKDVKFDAGSGGPFRLAYASPSFESGTGGPVLAVLIYEVNADYDPGAQDAG